MFGRSMLAYIPVNLATLIVSFGNIIILTRLLDGNGGAEYGNYAIAMVAIQFFHMLFLTWLEAAMARYHARAETEDNVPTLIKTLYTYGFIMAAISFTLMLIGLFFIPLDPRLKTVLGFALGSTCFQVFANLSHEAHKAAHRIGRFSRNYSFQIVIAFSAGIILILTTNLRELGPLVGIIIGIAFVAIVDFPFMLRQAKGGHVDKKAIKLYFNYGFPICISLVLSYALSSADVFIIGIMMDTAAAGQYSAGYNLANRTLDILFVWIGMAITPIAVTTLEKTGLAKSQKVMRDYCNALLFVTLPAATGIALIAEPAGFIIGESVRAGAVSIMPPIAFAAVLNGMISFYAQRAFMLSGKPMTFIWALIPPVIINIGLNIWLIPLYGLMGAVIATIAAYSVGFVLAIIVGRRLYPLPLPFKSALQILLSCLVMAYIVHVFPIPDQWLDWVKVIIMSALGASIYLSMAYVLNIADCRTMLGIVIDKIKDRGEEDIVAENTL